MSLAVIKEISEAETKASEIIEQAKADAQAAVKKAQQDAAKRIDDKTSEAKRVAGKTFEQAKDEALENMESILKENEKVCEQIHENAIGNYSAAKKFILDRIEG